MRQLQEEISSAEFAQWQAYDMLEPIGSDTIEHAIAELCALTFNIHKRKDVEDMTPSEFKYRLMPPEHVHESLVQTPVEEMDEQVHQFFAGVKQA